MKKTVSIALVLLFCAAMVLTTGCKRGERASASTTKEFTLVSNKIEIDAALKDYAAVYERQTGVKVNVRSFGGETPYAPALSAMFSAGDEPEIFVIEGKA